MPETCPARQKKPGGHAVCAWLAALAAQKKPASQGFAKSAELAQERQKPGVQAAQAPAPAAALKEPGGHARPTPVSVLVDSVCDVLTVPAHVPEVQGFGESVRTVVPAATPAPATTMPTERVPDDTAEMESPTPTIEPEATPVAVPAGQRVPAGH